MSSSNKVYGIDLGTTYSCIAHVDEHGKPVVIPNSEGQTTTPSVVLFEPDNIAVGMAAKDVAELYPDRVISTVKRVMGDESWTFQYEGNTYHPQNISAFILRKLTADAQKETAETVTDVVITCPAYFGTVQKEATKQAGTLAGLNVRYVIPEPVAAALAYGIEQSQEQVLLVYDLGGGTFDVTVIKVTDTEFDVRCTGGDHNLGGRNWDETIAAWFADQFAKETGVDADQLTSDAETWQDLLKVAEKAKMTLSSRTSCEQAIRFDVHRQKIVLTREKFDELTRDLLERTITLTKALLETPAAKSAGKIDKLLLVGGSTYMPQVIERVKEAFPFESFQFDPNQAVAKGAALYGFKCYLDEQIKVQVAGATGEDAATIDIAKVPVSVLTDAKKKVADENGLTLPALGGLTDRTISNVTSRSFGIVVVDANSDVEQVNNLIVVQQSVPCTVTRSFGTHKDKQDSVSLRCMENTESIGPDDGLLALDTSTEIGRTDLPFTRPLPKGSPIEVNFSLSEDGLLNVHGKDLTTHQEIKAHFVTTAILTEEQLKEMKGRDAAMSVT